MGGRTKLLVNTIILLYLDIATFSFVRIRRIDNENFG